MSRAERAQTCLRWLGTKQLPPGICRAKVLEQHDAHLSLGGIYPCGHSTRSECFYSFQAGLSMNYQARLLTESTFLCAFPWRHISSASVRIRLQVCGRQEYGIQLWHNLFTYIALYGTESHFI